MHRSDIKLTAHIKKGEKPLAKKAKKGKTAAAPRNPPASQSQQFVQPDPVTVKIVIKEGDKIGLTLDGPMEEAAAGTGVFIRSIRNGSPAQKAKLLMPGMRIISLNNVDVLQKTKRGCMKMLKTMTKSFSLVAQYDPKGYELYDGGVLIRSHTGQDLQQAQYHEIEVAILYNFLELFHVVAC